MKLCLGLCLFTTRPSAARTFRTHCQWLAKPLSQSGREETYAIDLAAYILVYYNPRDSGKAGEEKFGNGAYRVCSRYVDYCRTAGRNLEAEEVFYRS